MVKWFSKAKYIVIGVVVGVFLSGSIAFAANNEYLLSLFEVKMIFNGVEKQGSDKPYQFNNGTAYVPTSLIYNGTTYVPLRFFSESIGEPIKYDGKTKTIYVGQVPEESRVWRSMNDILQPYYKNPNIMYISNPNIKMGGNKHSSGYQMYKSYNSDNEPGLISFNLQGNYQTIKGLIGLDDTANKYDEKVEFYIDDKLLKSYSLKAGGLPENFEIDVTGAVKLDIYLKNENSIWGQSTINLADIMIK